MWKNKSTRNLFEDVKNLWFSPPRSNQVACCHLRSNIVVVFETINVLWVSPIRALAVRDSNQIHQSKPFTRSREWMSCLGTSRVPTALVKRPLLPFSKSIVATLPPPPPPPAVSSQRWIRARMEVMDVTSTQFVRLHRDHTSARARRALKETGNTAKVTLHVRFHSRVLRWMINTHSLWIID